MPSIACIVEKPIESCFKGAVGSVAGSAVPAAWDAICKSFVSAASSLLRAFANAFTSVPDVNPASAGISGVYGMTLALSAVVAVLLVFGQVIRTALTASGDGLAQALIGGAKAFMAWVATAAVATAALAATDNATRWVIQRSFGSQAALAVRLGDIVNWSGALTWGGQAAIGASLLLVVALIGIVLVIVLWFELLLRGAALSVLIAMSPLAAAGQMSETTKVWWQRTCSAAVQLLILKLVIALVFAVGFSMAGTSKSGVESLLEGLLVLALGVFSWPVVARFFTFATIQASSSGLATALGFAAGRLSSGGGGNSGGPVSGVSPDQWSQTTEQRTMAGRGGLANGGGTGGFSGTTGAAGPGGGLTGGAAGGTAGAGGGTGASGGGNGAAVLAGVAWALQQAHNAGSALAGRMENTAAHAGMHGAYPYSTVGGSGTRGQRPRRSSYGPGTPQAPLPPPDPAGPGADAPEGPGPAASPPPHASQHDSWNHPYDPYDDHDDQPDTGPDSHDEGGQ